MRQGADAAVGQAVAMIADRSQLTAERIKLIDAVAEVKAEGGGKALLACLGDASLAVRKAALIEDVRTEMATYEQGDRLVYPDAVHVALRIR